MEPRVLVIDHFDSFTWNLAALLKTCGAQVQVARPSALTVDELSALHPDGVVFSPGPGRPEEINAGLMRAFWGRTPILGVCLGCQMIACVAGGRVIQASEPVHGKTSTLHHDADGLFVGLPQGLRVMRYHSLVVADDELPANLRVTARTDDGLIMGLKVTDAKVCGVQFHPESILTESGATIIRNWLSTWS